MRNLTGPRDSSITSRSFPSNSPAQKRPGATSPPSLSTPWDEEPPGREQQHAPRGHILVESEPGRGSTFRVFLPRVGAEADQVRERPAIASPVEGGVVLLVEDDDAVRTIARRILVRAGYSVVEAANGRQALDLAGGGMDLVISDVVMPDMGGPELQKRLREQYPNLKVILTSGYSEAEVTGEIRQLGAAFLPKPFTPQSLISCVTEVLGGASQGR